jgi:hypothetical protein
LDANSISGAIIEMEGNSNPVCIIATGFRIIPMGRELNKSKI